MNRLIINADDCGISDVVNTEIRRCIEDGIITSTTMMANMPAFEGAIELYQKFHERIPFGIHFNLTEGRPILYSQRLLDAGYYVEREGEVRLNAKEYDASLITSEMKLDIMEELRAQAQKIFDSGITPSHIDSHQHVHWRLEYLPLFCRIAREFHVEKMRREYNYGGNTSWKNHLRRMRWKYYMKWNNHRLSCPDRFTDIFLFFNDLEKDQLPNNKTFELMCHPGHRFQQFKDEIELISSSLHRVKKEYTLITYNEL